MSGWIMKTLVLSVGRRLVEMRAPKIFETCLHQQYQSLCNNVASRIGVMKTIEQQRSFDLACLPACTCHDFNSLQF